MSCGITPPSAEKADMKIVLRTDPRVLSAIPTCLNVALVACLAYIYMTRETSRSDEMKYTVSPGGCWHRAPMYVQ